MSEITTLETEKRPRSAAYPAINIEEAIDFVSQIKKSFPSSWFKREDISAILKRAVIHRDIAAAAQYGLLERKEGVYRISPGVQEILNYVTEEERRQAILKCFKSPKLYNELIERFSGHVIPPDNQLKVILVRFHHITESAAEQAADVFISNALFAGALNENRILFGETNPVNTEKRNSNPDQVIVLEEYTDSKSEQSSIDKNALPAPMRLEEINGSQDLKIKLSEKKFARLIYPENMNERDIQILKLQLEALSLAL